MRYVPLLPFVVGRMRASRLAVALAVRPPFGAGVVDAAFRPKGRSRVPVVSAEVRPGREGVADRRYNGPRPVAASPTKVAAHSPSTRP